MKGLIIVILGIFIFGILGLGFVSAEENCIDTCANLNYSCGTQIVCNSSINCGNCSYDKICQIGKCVINKTGEDDNKTEVDDEKPACSTINNTSKCWARKDCSYNISSQTCQERPVKQKKLKEAVMNYLNSSECPENCTCAGSTIKCETENGGVMTVIAGKSGNIIIQTKGINATTSVVLIKNATGLYGTFAGKVKKIKYLPDEIKERVLKKLKLEICTDCNMVLNEDGNYVMNINGTYKVFWIFPKKGILVTKVNSETGEVTVLKKPFWKFRTE